MSIDLTRISKTSVTNVQDILGNFDSTAMSIVSSSHLKHVSTVWLLKFKMWKKQFAHLSKKFSSKFDTVKVSARRFFLVGNFDTTKLVMKFIYEGFRNAVNLQLKHVLGKSCFCRQSTLADKEAAIAIDKTGKINKVINRDLRQIQSCKTIAHSIISIVDTDSVQYTEINVHAERLNEWNASNSVCESLASQVTVRGRFEEVSPPKCL